MLAGLARSGGGMGEVSGVIQTSVMFCLSV